MRAVGGGVGHGLGARTGALKTLLFMAGGKCERWGRWVWAVRAAGVGHGLEPVKHCFSWQALEGGGASASGGGGEGSGQCGR